MNAPGLSLGLLTLALASGIGAVAYAQDRPPYDNQPQYGNQYPNQQPQYGNQYPNQQPQYGDQNRGDRGYDNPGLSAGFRDGFDNGSKDAYDHHTYVPERAFRHNGRSKFRQQFGDRRNFYRAYHEGYVRGYERGYNGGDANDYRRDRDDRRNRDDHRDRDDH